MPDLTPPRPAKALPPHTSIGQARSGRWWVQCTRPSGCDFYSSCLLDEDAAYHVAEVHSAVHERFATPARTGGLPARSGA